MVRAHVQFKKEPIFQVKNYILDTNVLLHDPNSLLAFKGNTVLIPIEVSRR